MSKNNSLGVSKTRSRLGSLSYSARAFGTYFCTAIILMMFSVSCVASYEGFRLSLQMDLGDVHGTEPNTLDDQRSVARSHLSTLAMTSDLGLRQQRNGRQYYQWSTQFVVVLKSPHSFLLRSSCITLLHNKFGRINLVGAKPATMWG